MAKANDTGLHVRIDVCLDRWCLLEPFQYLYPYLLPTACRKYLYPTFTLCENADVSFARPSCLLLFKSILAHIKTSPGTTGRYLSPIIVPLLFF